MPSGVPTPFFIGWLFGTRYLDEPILDLIKQQAMSVPFLRELLRNDWIDIKNNIKIHDLGPVLTFVGKGQEIYGYPHFVNDVGGSLCELDEPGGKEAAAQGRLDPTWASPGRDRN